MYTLYRQDETKTIHVRAKYRFRARDILLRMKSGSYQILPD